MLVFSAQASAQQPGDEAKYRSMIESARSGRVEEALPYLREMVRRYPAQPRYLYDLIAVLGWAGRDREAVALAPRIDVDRAPPYTLTSLAKSARNSHDYKLAEQLYRAVLKREPKQRPAQAGLAMTLADDGRGAQALPLLQGWLSSPAVKQADERLPLLRARAYIYERLRDPIQELETYQDILALSPQDREALRNRILLTDRIGAPYLALALLAQTPGVLSAAEENAIRQDQTAISIRWGEALSEVKTGRSRYTDTDRALAQSAEARASLARAGQAQSPAELRTLFDEIVALRDRTLMREAIARYEALLTRGVQPPPYVTAAAADAYLYERQPARARDLYRDALARVPATQDSSQWQVGLYYAYLESEDFDRAQALIDRLAAQARLDLKRKGLTETDKIRAFDMCVTQALSRLYADDPKAAERLLESLLQQAPHNVAAEMARASVHAARGQPRAAAALFRRLLVDGPNDLGARIGYAETLLTLKQYEQAEHAMADLTEEYPENRAVQRAADAWDAHNRWLFTLDGQLAHGQSIVTGNREHNLEAYLYSPPFAYSYRAYLRSFDAEAKFDGATAVRRRLGIGLERRVPDWELAGELSQDLDGGGRPGIALRSAYEPEDAWQLRLGYSSNSDEVPLKAEIRNIRASDVNVGASYSPYESRSLSLTANYMEFDDGNRRTALSARGLERLVTGPRYKLDIDGNLYTSHNTKTDVPYFSPAKDASVDLSLVNQWLTWRSYERSFKQRLALTAGDYWQQGFGSGPILGLRYEQEWEQARWLTLRYGVGALNRPFDGQQETRSYLYLTLNWRF